MTGLIVALDFSNAEDAIRMARRVEPSVDGFKVGLELLLGPGPGTIAAVRNLGKPVFVDAKLHDIPATVARATGQIARYGGTWLTVHAAAGAEALAVAVEVFRDAGPADGGIVAITVLTSLGQAGLAKVGVTGSPGRQVSRLTRLAADAAVTGVVSSVHELGVVAQVAPDLLRFTPGIRPAGSAADDQARVATPAEARQRGASYVIVGRPITRADDPARAADAVAHQIQEG